MLVEIKCTEGRQSPSNRPRRGRVELRTALAASLLLCTGLALADSPRGNVTWVGGDSQCDFSSLSEALDQAGSGDEIHIARNGSYNNVPYSINQSIRLAGGYPECQTSADGDNTALAGGLADRVVQVFHPNQAVNLEVELINLDIGGGSSTGNGGGLSIGTDHSVAILDSTFAFNSSDANGGAISVGPGSSLELHGSTELALNGADGDGGGIGCLDGLVVIGQGTVIRANSGEFGGGIHADGCEVRLYSGGAGNLGVQDNNANERGGGIHAINNAELLLDGSDAENSDPGLPVVVSGNESGWSGGGIALVDGSEATLINTIVEDNVADSGGAGIYTGLGASLDMRADLDSPCREQTGAGPVSCSAIRGNESEASPGSIVRGIFNSSVEIRQTEIRDNIVQTGGILQIGRGSLLLENALIAENQNLSEALNSFVVRATQTDDVYIRFSTFADHQGPLSDDVLIDLFTPDDEETRVALEGLVIDQPGATVAQTRGDGDGALSRAVCIVAPETDSLEELASEFALVGQLFAEDPLLIDPEAGNYRLSAASPAVDACALVTQPQPLIPPEFDIDGFARGQANSEDGSSTPFDLGAFERLGERLFQDRFEAN